MSSIIGNNIKVSLFGESHKEYIGATIDGLPSGIKLDLDFFNSQMQKRRASLYTTLRKEKDDVQIISGVKNNYTTGTPLTILIKNKDIDSSSYKDNENLIRPGHVDYVSYLKYHGYEDNLGSGHFSGRLTAPLVYIGAIALQILKSKGINIGSHIYKLYDVEDALLNYDDVDKMLNRFNNSYFPLVDETKEEIIKKKLINARENNDSLGGILETIITFSKDTVIGEPFFDSLESKLSSYIFSIGGVKGIEFGLGFDFAKYKGSEIIDYWCIKDSKIISKHNYNGGINGGINNLSPIIFRTCFKPTASIAKEMKSINLKTKKEENMLINGRHDPCILIRGRVVVDSLTALALLDLLSFRYGNEWLR